MIFNCPFLINSLALNPKFSRYSISRSSGSSKVRYKHFSPRRAAKVRICRQKMVFPLPGPPVTNNDLPCGIPLSNSSSNPGMPVWIYFTISLLFVLLFFFECAEARVDGGDLLLLTLLSFTVPLCFIRNFFFILFFVSASYFSCLASGVFSTFFLALTNFVRDILALTYHNLPC